MKFGVSYNIFNGEELLEASIKSIRESVDYVSVVYQTTSNHGNECSEELVPLLNKLKEDGIVDILFEYKPDKSLAPKVNELKKRNIGLLLSKRNGCDYHMAMDSDEFYVKEELEFVKKDIVDNDIDATACQMTTYYKSGSYRVDPKEEYYVSLFFKIQKGVEYELNAEFPVLVDPSRKMKPTHFKSYNRDEIEMYHMSYVRDDIRSKVSNASSRSQAWDVDSFVDYYVSWEYPMKAKWPDGREFDIMEVENKFNV